MPPETSTVRPEKPTAALEAPAPASSTPIEDAATLEAQVAAEKAAKRTQLIIIVAGIVFLLLLIAAVTLMASFPSATTVIRDIAIVFVAVETFVIGLAAILLIFQVQMLIQVLRDEVQPLLRSVNDTASTVRGTTEFVSHNMVSPFIRLAGFAAAAQRVSGDLLAVVKNTRPHSRPKQTGGKEDVQSGE